MGLFNFKKKQPEKPTASVVNGPVILTADAIGKIIPMEQVPDDVFSQGILGFCCGIDPSEGKVYAPTNGKISSLTDTLHAVCIEGDGGIGILIHVGVDTVEMKGDGFSCKVKEGDTVKAGQLLLTMDLEKIKAAGHPAVVITAVTNTDDFSNIELIASGNVNPNAEMLKINKNI